MTPRTRTSRTTEIDLARAITMSELVPPARNDVPERDTTVYVWPDHPVRARTTTIEMEAIRCA